MPPSAQERKEGERVVRVGETFEHKKVVVEIRELAPNLDPYGRPAYLVGVLLKDATSGQPLMSDLFHFTMRKTDDPRPRLEKIIDDYLNLYKDMMKGHMRPMG